MIRSGNTYDAIIIGAGISGLVCGCYLAKAGMKVLIAEQHYKPGGYCSSFRRNEFTFDAAAHCFGGYRKEGITRRVFNDLKIDERLKIIRHDPSNVIVTPNCSVSFRSDFHETAREFQKAFPQESKGINDFFRFILSPDANSFSRMRSWTLMDLLDQYFTDDRLKTVLSAPLLGIGGLPPSRMSAFIGSKLFSEFLLDGGYHPEGGMQRLSDLLAKRFQELGGTLLLSCLVKKIKVKDNKVKGVILGKDDFLSSVYIISNCDARQTFMKLLGKKKVESKFYSKIKEMKPSISNFILYLGMDTYFESLPKTGTTLCFFPHYDLDMAYKAALEGDIERYGGYMLYVYEDRPAILAIIPAPFKSKRFWDNNKDVFANAFIHRIEKYSIPHLSEHIIYKDSATPHTLYRYTLNYRGASFGWEGTPSQLALSGFSKPSFVEGLYLTGHWTTLGIGISGVVYVGYDTAKKILRRERLN